MIEFCKDQELGNPQNATLLQMELGISPQLSTLLCARGYDTPQAARAYLYPMEAELHPPMGLKDMERARDAVLDAMAEDRLICLFGDYDVDGIMAVTILTRYLKEQGARVTQYIPSRHTEGYGLNAQAIESLAAEGVGLIVTVDCGVTALEEVALARRLGMEVVVTDHHQCLEALPDCAAVVDPARPDEDYAYRSLCGAGVALKLVQALGGVEEARRYTDCAALATLADIVPLTGENRTIVAWGLDRINRGLCLVGIREMAKASGYEDRTINSGAVSFGIAPRINAAGRVGSARTALELFLTDDVGTAARLARQLDEENSRRRAIENEIYLQAMEMIASDAVDLVEDRGIILVGSGWNHGVIGIVASKLVERYCRPVILLSEEEGLCIGSGRSVRGVHLFDALNSMSELFVRFGGHEMAAGLTIAAENLEQFKSRFFGYLKETVSSRALLPKARYDAELAPEQMSLRLAEELQLMGPFGMGNPSPVFRIRGVQPKDPVVMGANGRHLKFSVARKGKELKCVAFEKSGLQEVLGQAEADLTGSLEINDFRGERSEQVIVKSLVPVMPENLEEYINANAGKFSDAILAMSRYNSVHEQKRCLVHPTFVQDWLGLLKEWIALGPFGSAVLCATKEGARRFMERAGREGILPLLDVHFGQIDDERAFNSLLLAPKPGELRAYKRVLVMERLPETVMSSFAGQSLRAFYTAGEPLKGLAALEAVGRQELVPVYGAMMRLSASRTGFLDRSAYFKALSRQCGVDADILALGAEVFLELGFFSAETGGAYRVNPVKAAPKRQLADSETLQAVKAFAALCKNSHREAHNHGSQEIR